MKYDLHIHSDVSDGKLSRKKIIEAVIEEQLEYISFTEHNDFQPIENEDMFSSNNLKFINGIEFDVFFQKSFHTLCYFSEFNKEIASLIKKYHENTNDRSDLLIKKICDIHNICFTLTDLQQFFSKEYISKRDIIDWLLFNNYAHSVTDAADNFTNKKSKSYVPKYSLQFREVAEVINDSKGIISLAHPITLNYSDDELDNFIKQLITQGLTGIEVINTSKVSFQKPNYYKILADKYDLITSCGSDFHDSNIHCLGIENDISKRLIKIIKKD